jgi:hypothetical protein
MHGSKAVNKTNNHDECINGKQIHDSFAPTLVTCNRFFQF